MTFEQFKDACFRLALEKGCDNAEIYSVSGDSFSVNVLSEELDRYSVARENGLNLRVLFDGKNGYAYTELFEDPEFLVDRAIDNAKAIETTDVNPMQDACEYPEITPPENPIMELSESEKIGLAMRLERDTLAFDGRVNRMGHCSVSTGTTHTHICNTLGLNAESSDNFSYAVIGPILRQGEDENEAYAFRFGKDLLDCSSMIKESVDNALMRFNARTVDSGEYRVLIRYDAAADLLQAFSGMFSADSVQKGLSLLAGKLGEQIAAENITIFDDPFEKDNPRAFDDEGVPSVMTTVVENGVLKSYLHNLKTALKDGVASTSNAGRPGVAAPIGIAATNFYIAPGIKTYDQMIGLLDNGLIITELGGLHAGLNPVSGDFSLIASGLLVQNGSILRSVEQITCAGNFLELMKNIETVGSDLHMGLPGNGRFGSPSLLISKLIISGK